jgi:hypothetical protein
MISIIGLGNAASQIAEKFVDLPQYNVFSMNDNIIKSSKYRYKLKRHDTPEQYEDNIPNLKKFFAGVDDHIQFFVVGSSYSSNYSLGILEQLKDKKIDLFYIKPDTELLTGIPKLLENAVFGILQQYARSALLNSMAIISNLKVEEVIGDVPIKTYYDVINNSIFSAVHYLNYFIHTEPEIGQISQPLDINRVKTIGVLNMENLEEKWFFDLDIDRDLCYYMCINKKKLETDGGLHRRLVEMLKEKPRNAFRRISYAIYETELEQDFGFCVAHTNAIQKNS